MARTHGRSLLDRCLFIALVMQALRHANTKTNADFSRETPPLPLPVNSSSHAPRRSLARGSARWLHRLQQLVKHLLHPTPHQIYSHPCVAANSRWLRWCTSERAKGLAPARRAAPPACHQNLH